MNPSIEYSQIAPAIIVFTAAIVGVLVGAGLVLLGDYLATLPPTR